MDFVTKIFFSYMRVNNAYANHIAEVHSIDGFIRDQDPDVTEIGR